MKKFTIIALALCLAFVMAAPVMAVDADFSGSYRVRGFYVSQYDLRDTTPSHDYMDMRFRLQTKFKVSDILSVTVRFDALDGKVWGDSDNPVSTSTFTATDTADTVATSPSNNIDFDRAYMTIKAPIGKFDIGRMAGGTWGTKFLDSVTEKDRIKFTKTIENSTLYLVYQKNTEADDATSISAADQDSETYYVLAKQKMENTTAGLLLAFTNDKTDADLTKRTYSAAPYFVSKFGPLAIQGELQYNWGQTDYDTAGSADLDIKELAYNIEATYKFGPASVQVGYAFVSGDNNSTDDNEDSTFDNGVGGDWEKLFILTTDEVTMLDTNLGGAGVGNLSDDGSGLDASGAKILYGGVTFSPLDNLKLGVVVGSAKADEAPTGYQDDYGIEYDFTLNWKIYDNLTYKAIVAVLDAGDYYYEGATQPANFDDTYALFHQLVLKF